MNIALRKLALLEKSLGEREEMAKLGGYVTSPVDVELRTKITKLMEQIKIN